MIFYNFVILSSLLLFGTNVYLVCFYTLSIMSDVSDITYCKNTMLTNPLQSYSNPPQVKYHEWIPRLVTLSFWKNNEVITMRYAWPDSLQPLVFCICHAIPVILVHCMFSVMRHTTSTFSFSFILFMSMPTQLINHHTNVIKRKLSQIVIIILTFTTRAFTGSIS